MLDTWSAVSNQLELLKKLQQQCLVDKPGHEEQVRTFKADSEWSLRSCREF